MITSKRHFSFAESLAARFARGGEEVFMATDTRGEGRYNGFSVFSVPYFGPFFIVLSAMRLFFHKVDVLVLHGDKAGFALIARILRPSAIIVWMKHEGEAGVLQAIGEWMAVRSADLVFAVNDPLRRSLLLRHGIDAELMIAGVEKKRVCVNPYELEALDLAPQQYILVDAARMHRENLNALVSAWLRADTQDVKLAILGAQAEPNHALESSIVWLGDQRTTDVIRTLFGGAIAIATGGQDGVLEVLSFGKAPIARKDVSLSHDVLPFGYFVRDDFDGVIDVILKNRMEAVSLGHAGREFVEDLRDWDKVALALADDISIVRELRDGIIAF